MPDTDPDNVKLNDYKMMPGSLTARVAVLLLIIFFIPIVLTGVAIEAGMLLPGRNVYLAIPIFLLPLLVPFSRLIAHYIINKDLILIQKFCEQVRLGNYQHSFDLPNQKEDEDDFIHLLRNLTWMARSIEAQNNMQKARYFGLQSNLAYMQYQAFSDGLTGLYNRRYLENYIKSCRGNIPHRLISMIYIDCDKFKRVNDTLGHEAGDKVLLWLANCIREASRSEKDIPLRLGGDEFAMLVMDADNDEAGKVAERINKIYHQGETHGTTLSIGIANIDCNNGTNWDDINQLSREADEQAYKSKRAGGNRITMKGEIVRGNHKKKRARNSLDYSDADRLTSIPNRYAAREKFNQSIEKIANNSNRLCLLFVDLDGFAAVNQSYGSHVGDQYLQHLVKSVGSTLRTEDSIYRIGGDKFVIIIEAIKERKDAPPLAVKISEALHQPASIEGSRIVTASSMSILVVPDDGDDFDELSGYAADLIAKAKEGGINNFCFFDPDMTRMANEMITMITRYRPAILPEQMEVNLQPKMDARAEKIVGAEVVLRWNHMIKKKA